tara:strand:- start:3260 stop:3943 length:684 start_codon:yes stop_codon:yes gene_type:complete
MDKIFYEGWELEYFDKALNFRNYQFDLVKNFIKGFVAEVGPGNGSFLQYYSNKVDQIDLYEPSENFLENLNKFKNEKIKIINSNFNQQNNKYDTILYLDVLEHIEDHEKELDIAYKSLKEGGALILNVPAFQHLYSKFDKDINHFRRYSKNDLKRITKKFNFSSTNLIYYDSVGYLLSIASKLITRNYLNNFEKKIQIWDKLIPLSRIIDLIIFNTIGKSLIMICTK